MPIKESILILALCGGFYAGMFSFRTARDVVAMWREESTAHKKAFILASAQCQDDDSSDDDEE